MKFLAAFAILPLAASAVTVAPLPPSEYADTEISTNFPIVVDFGRMNRLEFTLSLNPSPSNCVEVAVGTDVDQNGVLSPDEADYTFGCDCGRWFRRDSLREQVKVGGEGEQWNGSSSRAERTFVLKKRDLRTDWNLVRVTRRGPGDADEFAEIRERTIGLMLWLR